MSVLIPAAALEAGARAFTDAMLTVPQPDPIRAAFLAMLRAWGGMQHDNYVIVLPLPPQEASDAEA